MEEDLEGGRRRTQLCPGDVAEGQKPECRLLPSYPRPNLRQTLDIYDPDKLLLLTQFP